MRRRRARRHGASARRRSSSRRSCAPATAWWSSSSTGARQSAPATTSSAWTRPSWAALRRRMSRLFSLPRPRFHDGFVSPELKLAVIPFRRLVHRRRAAAPAPSRGRLAAFTDLRVGDHVVHEDHGIARFAGFETKTVGGVTRDYLELEYRGSDRVFAPTDQLAKITRYVGTGGAPPQFSALGSKRWEGIKARARRAARELAGELLNLYAERRARTRPRVPARRRVAAGAGAGLPVPRDRRPARGDRGGQGGHGGTAADGPPDLRRRRLRQDRGRAPRRAQGGLRRQAGDDARADDDPGAAAPGHVPRAAPGVPDRGRDGLAAPQAGRGPRRPCRGSPTGRSTS